MHLKSTIPERFWAKVKKDGPSGCWLWQGARLKAGYGLFQDGPKLVLAHRWAWQQVHGPIPKGVVLDHLCRNRPCVNLNHLEPVSNRVNILRGFGQSAVNALKLHCPSGHPYSGENLYVDPTGRRQCRICRAEKDRARKLRTWQGNPPNYARTHCPKGHPYAGQNLIRARGRRICRACKNARWRRWRANFSPTLS